MIHIIIPSEAYHYTDLLRDTFERAKSQNLPYPDFLEKSAIDFIGIDDKFGICGSARLRLSTQIKNQPWSNPLLIGELHFVNVFEPQQTPISEVALAAYASRFYYDLYEALYQVCLSQKIYSVYIIGHPLAIQDLWHIGWPLQETRISFIYSKLPLTINHINMEHADYEKVLKNRSLFEKRLASAIL